jgi:hypothetical protein
LMTSLFPRTKPLAQNFHWFIISTYLQNFWKKYYRNGKWIPVTKTSKKIEVN